MSHRAGAEFFRQKLEWSCRKDQILATYLKRYLPTLAHRLRSTRAKVQGITVVDGFAGPGTFQSGEDGSPLIICKAVVQADDVVQQTTRVLCIERSTELAGQLEQSLRPYRFAEAKAAKFQAMVDELVGLAARSNLLLYLDPFTVDGLQWKSLDKLFAALQQGISIEVLLNFNAAIFLRAGLAALQLKVPMPNPEDEDPEGCEPFTSDGESPAIARLDEVAGGDWWQTIAKNEVIDFATKVDVLTRRYCEQLRSRFAEVCSHAVFAKVAHNVPKYALVFGSRSPTALLYMNDAMVGARDTFAEASRPEDPPLFELLPEALVPDDSKLPEMIVRIVDRRMTRERATQSFVRAHFGRNTVSQIHRCIRELLRRKTLLTSARTIAIGDSAEIWPAGRP